MHRDAATALTELEHALELTALYRQENVRISLDAARILRIVVAEALTHEEPAP